MANQRLLEIGSMLKVTVPGGDTRHIAVDSAMGQYLWAGPYRIHYSDDRVSLDPPTWRTFDGVTLALSEAGA